MLNKTELLKTLEKGISLHMTKLSEKERYYVLKKGDAFIDLLIELENKNLLKRLDNDEVVKIRSELDNLVFNFEHIKNLYLSYFSLVDRNKQTSAKTEIKLKDDLGNDYLLTMNQIVTIFAWTYCSLCEFMRSWITPVIDFTKLKGRYPTGLGSLIRSLKDNGITNLSFFEDIDTEVRNSFFHLNFRFNKEKIYCKHKPEVYHNNSWRTQTDNNQSDYILLTDLIQLVLNGDRSSYTIMLGCEYFIGKSII